MKMIPSEVGDDDGGGYQWRKVTSHNAGPSQLKWPPGRQHFGYDDYNENDDCNICVIDDHDYNDDYDDDDHLAKCLFPICAILPNPHSSGLMLKIFPLEISC